MHKTARYQKAIALQYETSNDAAPLVCAKGHEFTADNIVQIAQRYGIPVVEQGELAQALYLIDEDQSIPEELFEAVAMVLNHLEDSSRVR